MMCQVRVTFEGGRKEDGMKWRGLGRDVVWKPQIPQDHRIFEVL